MKEGGSKCFPEYFSESAQEEIAKWGFEKSIPVYRVAKYGKNDNTAFLNYFTK